MWVPKSVDNVTWISRIFFKVAMDWRVSLLFAGLFFSISRQGDSHPIKGSKLKSRNSKHFRGKFSDERAKKGSIRIEGPWSSDSGLDRNVDPMEDSYVKKVIASNEGLNFNKDIAEAGEVFDVNGIEDFYDKNALITYEVNGHEIPVHMKPKVTPQTQPMFPEYGHDSPNDFSQSRSHRQHRPQSTTFYGLSMKDMPEYRVHDTPPFGNGKGEPVHSNMHNGMHRQHVEDPESRANRASDDQFLRDQQIFHGDVFHKSDSAHSDYPWKTADSSATDHQTESQDDKLSSEYAQAEEIAKASSKLQASLEEQEAEFSHAHHPDKTYFHRPDPPPEAFETDRNSNHYEGYSDGGDRSDRFAEERDESRGEEGARFHRPEHIPDPRPESPPVSDPEPAPAVEHYPSHLFSSPGSHEYIHDHTVNRYMKDPGDHSPDAEPTPFSIEREHEDAPLPAPPEPERFHRHRADSLSEQSPLENEPPSDNHFASSITPAEGKIPEPVPVPNAVTSSSLYPENHVPESSHFQEEHVGEEHHIEGHQPSEDSSKFFEQLEKIHEAKESLDAPSPTTGSSTQKQDNDVTQNMTKPTSFMEEAEKSKAKARLLTILGELTNKLKGMEDVVKDTKKSEPDVTAAALIDKVKEQEKEKESLKEKEESDAHKTSDHEDISDKVSKLIESYRQNDKPFITNTELIDYKAPDLPDKLSTRKDTSPEENKHNQGDVVDSLYQADEQQQRNKAEHHDESVQKQEQEKHEASSHHDNGIEAEISLKPKSKSSKVEDDYPDYNEVKDAAIFEHNYIRKKYHSSSLQWSDNLSDKAQKIADDLGQEKLLDISKVKRKPGENLALVKTNSLNVGKDSADFWASEANSYDFVSPILTKKNSDFVQMAWKASKEFGIGVAKAKDGENWIVVAMYDTPLNDDYKELKANVLPDQPLNDPYEDIIGRKK